MNRIKGDSSFKTNIKLRMSAETEICRVES